jgi:2-hydroxychromene-2-carboxylate isomerase
MSKTIDYYMSISSPWSYLGHERFVALAKKYSADVNLRVVDLARVFPVSGGLPLPKRAPQRQAYRMVELKRWKAHLGVGFNPVPKFFPVKGDPAARMVIAALPQGADRALALAGAYMRAAWADEGDVGDADTLTSVAAAHGFDGAKLLALSNEPATQRRYDEFTQHAIDQQVFGAPWYVYNGEPFWGQDRLSFLEKALAG